MLPVIAIRPMRVHRVRVDSLADRIVSAPAGPTGAAAEPLALCAIAKQDRMVLPCMHPAIAVTQTLSKYERLKLLLPNLDRTFLAELCLAERNIRVQTVFQP
jgi:tagaturonate reductase